MNAAAPRTILFFSTSSPLIAQVGKALGPLGLTITSESRPRDFLVALQRGEWGAVLLDLASSGQGNRGELLRATRKVRPTLPVIVLVGARDISFWPEALQMGATDVVSLPIQTTELKARVLGRLGTQPTVPAPSSSDAPVAPPGQVDRTLYQSLLRFHETCLQTFLGFEGEVLDLRDQVSKISSLGTADSVVRGQRLLLVCQDVALGEEMQAAVEEHGITVVQEFTGGGALDHSAGSDVDILICASELPDIDGAVVATSIKGDAPHVDVILLEGWGTDAPRAVLVDGSEKQNPSRPLSGVAELAAVVGQFAKRSAKRSAHKRLARVFRDRHRDFMRTYAELKLRLLAGLKDDDGSES